MTFMKQLTIFHKLTNESDIYSQDHLCSDHLVNIVLFVEFDIDVF